MLSMSTELFVYHTIHSYTGYGKGVIDGHFTKIMNILCAYVGAGFCVFTPVHLVYLLNYNGGEYNCIVKFIKQNLINIDALIA